MDPDYISIKYFPFCENIDSNIIELKQSHDTQQINKLLIYCKKNCKNNSVTEYSEYSIKDTFARVYTDNDNTQTIYFRRKLQLLDVDNIPGLFVMEIYNNCSEDDFPCILNLHNGESHRIRSYYLDDMKININDVFIKNKKYDSEHSYIFISKYNYIDIRKFDISIFFDNFIKNIKILQRRTF